VNTINGTKILVYDYLYKGREHARTAIELAIELDCEPRDISRAIERERRDGYPIAADCSNGAKGYYIPIDKHEMLAYCNRLANRVRTIKSTLSACRKAAAKL
jgi:hypothetical protein